MNNETITFREIKRKIELEGRNVVLL